MQSGPWNRHWLWLVLVASLAFNAGVGATAGVRAYHRYAGAPPSDEASPGRGAQHLMQSLDLTPEQQAQLQTCGKELRGRHCLLRDEIREETDRLAKLLSTAHPDREAVAAQVHVIADLREQLDRDMVDHLLEVRGRLQLQPAQHEAFNEVIRRTLHRGGHGDRGPRGHHRGMGTGRND